MRYLLTVATAHAERRDTTGWNRFEGQAACGAKAITQTATGPQGRKLCGRCVKIVEKSYVPVPRTDGGPTGWDVIEGVAALVNANWGSRAHAVLMDAAERAEMEELFLSTTSGDKVTREWVSHWSDERLMTALDKLTTA